MSHSAGERLGPYEILALIGKGGMGEVFRARDPRLRRDVAVKVITPALLVDPGASAERIDAGLAAMKVATAAA